MASRNDPDGKVPAGGFTTIDGEPFYRIPGYDLLPPFLMSIASDTDLWMFVSSNGGLTAGRVDEDGALFPYETVDRLHDGHCHTGPVTLLRASRGRKTEAPWEPFVERSRQGFRIERNLYKNIACNRLVFEEINHDLELVFRYRWAACDEYGWIRTASLRNGGSGGVRIELLDGLRNVLPYGAPLILYQQSSSLVDAYKRTDLDPDTNLGIFSLTSRIIDRAEAAEELRANAVWCRGLEDIEVCLSSGATAAFRAGERPPRERPLTGRRGNYLVTASLELGAGEQATWHIAADAGLSHVRLQELRHTLLEEPDMGAEIEKRLEDATGNLLRNVGSADGLQLTAHTEAYAHHLANVLFNNMRGGVFADNYDIRIEDLVDFIGTRNRLVMERRRELLEGLPRVITLPDLLDGAAKSGDADFERLCLEYLPIYFGRRHGDPSRPWNRFSIRLKRPDGGRALGYEGNWRDIFQNWEALSLSFPRFLTGIMATFVDASTVDGFNPYRITREGIDWEIVDPDDPWSYIGYWGDHQIVYLLKFLEAAERYYPGALEDLLRREIFCFADVPYRIKPYEEILKDPNSTILYDTKLAAMIDSRVERIGTDGKLLHGGDGSIYHVNLLEKLLIPALSKVSNLVPGGGIWMNTQRPEWNDANNALVGNGLSMVTLYHLRRYMRFLERLLGGLDGDSARISREVIGWFEELRAILERHRGILESDVPGGGEAKEMLDALGAAFSAYRMKVYDSGFGGKEELPFERIAGFCRRTIEYLDHSIRLNRREDGLYHSYNLLRATKEGSEIRIDRLYEMLEGQVAVLGSGAVGAEEAVALVSRLFESRMYDRARRSFMLYPERELPGFLERNAVPAEEAEAIPLLMELLEAGDRSIIERDAFGTYRFNGDFSNSRDVTGALDRLAARDRWSAAVAGDRDAVVDLFETVFGHAFFTGRSGAMYGYEGLGCIYWHMVSKLLLAVQEVALGAAREGLSPGTFADLAKAYYRVRAGLGFEKSAAEYGAFPTDPYSHTPAHGGARQPGMTGQVKEEIISRFGELGVTVECGTVAFRPALLRRAEFMKEPAAYRYYDLDGTGRSIELQAGSLAFTFCQVPVIYTLVRGEPWIRITSNDEKSAMLQGDRLDPDHGRALFDRTGVISRIDVGVPEGGLLGP